jgi:hypothetical protein
MQFTYQQEDIPISKAELIFVEWGIKQQDFELESLCCSGINTTALQRVFAIGLRSDNLCRRVIKQSGVYIE